jgi:hypothetical protein
VNNNTDPHLVGGFYQKNQFAQRVPTEDAGPMIEKSPDNTAVTGTMTKFMGNSNTCGWCHKSRKDVTNYIVAGTNTLTSRTWGPHEAGQLDIFSAAGGYHFPVVYKTTAKHLTDLKCTDCHMPPVAANSNYPNHSFDPQLSSCQSCHNGLKNFDNNDVQTLIGKALREFEAYANSKGWLTRSETGLYASLTAAAGSGTEACTPGGGNPANSYIGCGDGQFTLDRVKAGTSGGNTSLALTKDEAGALYNYFLIARGSALGVHNPIYVKQLIFDSIQIVKGGNSTVIPNRPN